VSYTLDQKQLDRIEDILKTELIDNGVRCVFLIDMAGNIITNLDNVRSSTTFTLWLHWPLAISGP